MSTSEPLWETMHAAYSPHRAPGNWRLGYAAELRAIADQIEQQFSCFTDVSGRIVVETMVNWLLTEADRAERGEE